LKTQCQRADAALTGHEAAPADFHNYHDDAPKRLAVRAHRTGVNTGDSNLARRIAALPCDSEGRLAVLKLFHCYSLATALVLLESSSVEQREEFEQALTDIFEAVEQS
jgi:hypothetical protein